MTEGDRDRRLGEVHVWSLRLDVGPAERVRLGELLSADEAARARRFVRASDRDHWVCAHGLLRQVLSRYTGLRAPQIAFERAVGGKPRLAGGAGPHFNLTHADGLALVAVSADREVGVDVERVRPMDGLGDLAARCFTGVERGALAAVAASQLAEAFFAGWTRKEAFLKLGGEGLARPLASFDVTLTPGQPARVLRVEGVPDAARRYTLRAVRPAPGYLGAVAVEGEGVLILHRGWARLPGERPGRRRQRAREVRTTVMDEREP
jgi:4'-phosphopantetheinyl transferase